MNNKKIGLVLVPLFLAIGIVGGIFIGQYLSQRHSTAAEEKLHAILGIINQEYVDDVNLDSLLEMGFADILSSLDPHSVYITAADFEDVNSDLQGSFSGVGISFQILNDTVTVVEVIAGGPAEKVGILAGDRIIKAEGKSLTGDSITNETVFKTLRGEKGSKVDLLIKRNSMKEPVSYDVIRDDIPVKSIDSYYMMDEEIGYIDVSKFSRTTYQEFINALDALSEQGAKKFMIDLRDNGGGLLDQVVLMANEFLPRGRMIVYTHGRNAANNMQYISDGTGGYQDAELVVLTNEYSASASEIFAGAIQDNDRGLVIGRRSFGKGLVQNQNVLQDNSAIRLTVARYYTPSGRCIQKEYKRGDDGKYMMDIEERYIHGEFYNADSIKLDKTKMFTTLNGRTVYGGGGVMPDVFVPQDTTGITSYYLNVSNKGLMQKFSFDFTDRHRDLFKNVTTLKKLLQVLPADNTLLENFVSYAAKEGVPARWYYINQSKNLILRNLKAIIARDVLGYGAMNEMLNSDDSTVEKAYQELKSGNSSLSIKKTP